MVCGDTSNGVVPLQHLPGLPVLASGAGGGWCGLLHPLLGPHHWQRHVLCPAGQYLPLIFFDRGSQLHEACFSVTFCREGSASMDLCALPCHRVSYLLC